MSSLLALASTELGGRLLRFHRTHGKATQALHLYHEIETSAHVSLTHSIFDVPNDTIGRVNQKLRECRECGQRIIRPYNMDTQKIIIDNHTTEIILADPCDNGSCFTAHLV